MNGDQSELFSDPDRRKSVVESGEGEHSFFEADSASRMNSELNPDSVSHASLSATQSDWSETNAALCLKMINGLGPTTFSRLMEFFGSAVNVLDASPSELKKVEGVSQKLLRSIANAKHENRVEHELAICSANQIRVLDQTAEFYPPGLKEIHDPPPILFCRGQWQPQDQIAIAIVGSRHATNYGLRIAEKLAIELSHLGFTIVSGLARGIDAAAHRGAIKAGGRTIGVLGGGVLNIYPPEHKDLADQVAANGVLVSEGLPLAPPKSGSFPSRNRIITGISLGVIVVEASHRSGALISARLAAEQGREVFAVPGQIDSRMSRGCHRLIRDGAKLVESAEDILDELGPLALPAKLTSDNTVHSPTELKLGEQERLVLNAISKDGTSFDQIVVSTALPPPRILSTISILEIRGLIRRTSGTNFVRK